MHRRAWAALVLLTLFSRPALGAENEPTCFDLAVIAHITGNVPTAFPPEQRSQPIAHWPWIADLNVEKVLLGAEGRGRLQTKQNQHIGYNTKYQHFLLLMKRRGDGDYSIVDVQPQVIRDREGRFVIPLTDPWVLHQGWNSSEFTEAAKPIRYRVADAWWLARWNMRDVRDAGANWAAYTHGHAVALRGLYIDDLVTLLRPRWQKLCGQ